MNVISKILGSSIAAPINAVANLVDVAFTSDEERLSKEVLLERLANEPLILQKQINKLSLAHKSLFVSGWPSFIGWICGLGCFYEIILRPVMLNFNINLIGLDKATLVSMTASLLGLATVGTFGKIKSMSKDNK